MRGSGRRKDPKKILKGLREGKEIGFTQTGPRDTAPLIRPPSRIACVS